MNSIQSCLEGVVPPIATPLTESGQIDQASLVRLARRLVTAGVKGIFALGSTGEGVYLSAADQVTVIEILSDRAGLGVPLLAGVVEPTAPRVVERAQVFLEHAVDALVVTGPFYAMNSETEIRAHFEYVAQRVDVPVLAYNIPVNTGYSLSPDLMAGLIADGIVAGVKDSSPDLEGFGAVASQGDPDQAAYFSGSDAMFGAALDAGANGAVAGLSNVAPELFIAGLAAHRRGDRSELAALQARITKLTEVYTPYASTHGVNSTQLGSIKTALKLQGVIESDQVNPPMLRSTPPRIAQVHQILAEVGMLDIG